VRQLLAQGNLAVEGDYGTLTLTAGSGEVLGGRRTVMLRREPERPANSRSAAKARGPALAELPESAAAAFEQLRAWRAATARELGVPAYVIFHDATLRQIATQAPTSLTGLAAVNGVGDNKLAKYGQQILDIVGAEA
jgi:ATP-dependent DNA helicase RecQ